MSGESQLRELLLRHRLTPNATPEQRQAAVLGAFYDRLGVIQKEANATGVVIDTAVRDAAAQTVGAIERQTEEVRRMAADLAETAEQAGQLLGRIAADMTAARKAQRKQLHATAQLLAIQQELVTQDRTQREVEELLFVFRKVVLAAERTPPPEGADPIAQLLLLEAVLGRVADEGIATPMIRGVENKTLFDDLLARGRAACERLAESQAVRQAIDWALGQLRRRFEPPLPLPPPQSVFLPPPSPPAPPEDDDEVAMQKSRATGNDHIQASAVRAFANQELESEWGKQVKAAAGTMLTDVDTVVKSALVGGRSVNEHGADAESVDAAAATGAELSRKSIFWRRALRDGERDAMLSPEMAKARVTQMIKTATAKGNPWNLLAGLKAFIGDFPKYGDHLKELTAKAEESLLSDPEWQSPPMRQDLEDLASMKFKLETPTRWTFKAYSRSNNPKKRRQYAAWKNILDTLHRLPGPLRNKWMDGIANSLRNTNVVLDFTRALGGLRDVN